MSRLISLVLEDSDVALIHGALVSEIDRVKEMRKDTKYGGGVIAHMFTYLNKLERLEGQIKNSMEVRS